MIRPTAVGRTLTRPSALDDARQRLLGELFQPLGKLLIAGLLEREIHSSNPFVKCSLKENGGEAAPPHRPHRCFGVG